MAKILRKKTNNNKNSDDSEVISVMLKKCMSGSGPQIICYDIKTNLFGIKHTVVAGSDQVAGSQMVCVHRKKVLTVLLPLEQFYTFIVHL